MVPMLVGLLLLITGCAPQPVTVTREPVMLHLVAAAPCKPLVERAAEVYESTRPWVTTELQVFNTTVAEEVLREGGADVAFLSWLWDNEGNGNGPLWTERFARDGVAVIVHPELPLTEVGLSQLREIFLGRLQTRDGVPFVVVSRQTGSGTRAAFERIALGGESATLNAVVVPTSESMVDYVASTPGAIGYVSTERLDDGVRVLAIDGVMPTEETIADGSYPLWRPLYLASKGEPSGEAREFAQWLLRGGISEDSSEAVDE
jgi:phosphate transport system substrate-binding protein